MDRALLISYLQAAADRVSNGEQVIADQCDLISTLERTGHRAASATALLRQLEQRQVQHVAERDRLREELAVSDAVDTEKMGPPFN